MGYCTGYHIYCFVINIDVLFCRDVKLGNILMDGEGQVKLADFGSARASAVPEQTVIATGTLGYIDPDFTRTTKFVAIHDLYAAGVVYLQLLTGQPALFGNGTLVEFCNEWLYQPQRLTAAMLDSRAEWPLDLSKQFAAAFGGCVGIHDAMQGGRLQPNRPTADLLLNALLPLTTVNPVPPTANIGGAPRECLVCMNKPRAVRFIPCGHLCCCADCAATVTAGEGCPVCRIRIRSSVPANAAEESCRPPPPVAQQYQQNINRYLPVQNKNDNIPPESQH